MIISSHHIINTCIKTIKNLIKPVHHNLPLFLICILMLGGFDLPYYQHLYHTLEPTDILSGFAEMIFLSYLICICSYLARRIRLQYLFYLILFVIYIVNFYLRYSFGIDISPKILLLIVETNAKEVSGFFKTYMMTDGMFKTIGAFFILMTMIVLGERYKDKIYRITNRNIIIGLLACLVAFGLIGGISCVGRYASLLGCHNTYEAELWLSKIRFCKGMPIPNLCYSVNATRMAEKDLKHMIEATSNCLKDVSCTESDSLNIILIIGESYNKYHAGLYGYYLDTTPYQCAEAEKGNLFAFNKVKAPHNMTSIVLKNVLCCNDVHEGERWYDYPYFPAIFKKAGYDVWLWDNQYKWDENAAWAFTLNSVMFNDSIMKISYTDVNSQCQPYDGELIADFWQKKTPAELGQLNFMIFHLSGQHFLAKNQYPNETKYNVFSAKDVKDSAPYLSDESRQRIAEYANATRYNDEVIHQIMEQVRHTNAILIYFPDHGEEVFDYRDFYGRQLLSEDRITNELIKNQLEIPFVVWCSDTWKEKHPQECENIKLAIDREFSTDNICHMLFRLAGIKTEEYKSTRDLLSPDFKLQSKTYDITSL